MPGKKFTFTFLLLVFSLCVYAGASGEDKPTKQASALVKEYALADDAIKPKIMLDFEKLARANPDNTNVIRTYSSLLSSRGEYKEALHWLEPVNKAKETPSLLLQECMLKDRIGDRDTTCYQRVITLSERSDMQNMDYLMALYFTDNEKFNTVKKRLTEKNHSLSNDFSIFEQDKRNVLLSIYP